MQAILINSFSQSSLLPVTVATPNLALGEVRVKTQASGVNPIDWKSCAGIGPVSEQQLPFVPGWEFAGIVEACSADVSHIKPGDQVFGLVRFPVPAGCFSDTINVPADEVCLRPHNVPATTAAGLGLAGLTAWQALFQIGELQKGERVLILGGAGGVGHLAIQLAKWAGASEIITTSSPTNNEFLTSLGADKIIDYHSQDVTESVQGIDLILDCIGGDTGTTAIACLGANGRCVTLPSLSKDAVINAAAAVNKLAYGCKVEPNAQQLKELIELVEQNKLLLHVSQLFPINELAQAFELSKTGRAKGKLVLTF